MLSSTIMCENLRASPAESAQPINRRRRLPRKSLRSRVLPHSKKVRERLAVHPTAGAVAASDSEFRRRGFHNSIGHSIRFQEK